MQKPEKILKRIILASSNKVDTVLNPFLGNGTRPYVEKRYRFKWVGASAI